MAEHVSRNADSESKPLLTPQGEEKNALGEVLRKQRKARGISLVEVSEHTKVGKRYLEALENGEYNLLPGESYIRGFLRAYAKYLELDDEVLLRQYLEFRQQEAQRPESYPDRAREKGEVNPSVWSALVVILVLAGLGIGFFLFWPTSLKVKPESKSDTLPLQAVNPNPAIAAAAPGANTGDELTLKVRAKEKTWITIMVDGRQEPDVTLAANEERAWTAKDRFVLWTGNAGGIEVTFNGEVQPPLGQSGEVRKEVIFERKNGASPAAVPAPSINK
jgi:transcriptional regulator with XRE-family HTH domain